MTRLPELGECKKNRNITETEKRNKLYNALKNQCFNTTSNDSETNNLHWLDLTFLLLFVIPNSFAV